MRPSEGQPIDQSHQAPFADNLVMVGTDHSHRLREAPEQTGLQVRPKKKRLQYVGPFFAHESPQSKQEPEVEFAGTVQTDNPDTPPAKLFDHTSA
jgi:8-oxo-dGTP pyrophosphatase MutT (NUDIX family)